MPERRDASSLEQLLVTRRLAEQLLPGGRLIVGGQFRGLLADQCCLGELANRLLVAAEDAAKVPWTAVKE